MTPEGAAKSILAAAALAVLWVLEGVLPMFQERHRRSSHDLANLTVGVINALMVAGLFAGATLWVTERAAASGFGLLRWIDGPPWVEWLAALILFDAWQYAWHQLNHMIKILWRFHAMHHSDEELDASSAVRFHTVEIFFSSCARLAVMPILGMSVGQLLLYETVLLPIILFHHSNVGIPERADRCLRWLIVSPWMHWVHHSREKVETNSNYASIFSVWDRLFGTYRYRGDPLRLSLGLDDWTVPEWRTIWGMIKSPFYKKCRMEAEGKK